MLLVFLLFVLQTEEDEDNYDSDSCIGSQDLQEDLNMEYKPSRALVRITNRTEHWAAYG